MSNSSLNFSISYKICIKCFSFRAFRSQLALRDYFRKRLKVYGTIFKNVIEFYKFLEFFYSLYFLLGAATGACLGINRAYSWLERKI